MPSDWVVSDHQLVLMSLIPSYSKAQPRRVKPWMNSWISTASAVTAKVRERQALIVDKTLFQHRAGETLPSPGLGELKEHFPPGDNPNSFQKALVILYSDTSQAFLSQNVLLFCANWFPHSH